MHDRAHVAAVLRSLRAVGVLVRRRPRARLPRQLPPDAVRVDYYSFVRGLAGEARAMVERDVLPMVPGVLREARERMGKSDADPGDVNRALDDVSARFFSRLRVADLEARVERVASRTSAFQREQLGKQVRAAVGVDVFPVEPNTAALVRGFVAENVALIRSVPNKYLDGVEKAVTAAVRRGERWESLASTLERRFGVAESDARLIARDQVGKLYGDLNQLRQERMGVERYVWRTMRDNRVREEHADREGDSFAWSDPPEDGHPGEAINCRCYAEPDLSALLEAL